MATVRTVNRRILLLTLIALAVLVGYSVALFSKPTMLEAAAWGLCVFAALLGYGSVLGSVSFPSKVVPLALRVVWGAGVVVGIGSVVTALRLMRPWLGILIVIVGLLFSVVPLSNALENALARMSRRWTWRTKRPFLVLFALVVPALCIVAYLGGASVLAINAYDDELAYMTFPKQMLQTGAFDDPFSLRRVASYGGQSFLHALIASAANIEFLGIIDRGIFLVTCIAMLRARIPGRRRASAGLTVVLSVALMFMQNTSINSASNYSGLAGFIALFRTIQLAQLNGASRFRFLPGREVIAYALLGTLLATFRQNFLPMVVIALVAALAIGATRESGLWARLRRITVDGASLAIVSFLLLAGWMWQIRVSSGTAFFPVQPGNLRAAFTMRSPSMTPLGELEFFWTCLRWHEPFVGWPLLLAAIPFLRFARADHVLQSFAVGSLFAYLFLVHSFTLSDAENFARYTYPFVMATFVCAALVWSESASSTASGSPVLVARVLRQHTGLLLPVGLVIVSFAQCRENLRWIFECFAHSLVSEPWRASKIELYRRAESSVPRGETMLVMVDEPYRFDYAQHRIYNLDVPGAVTPKPGMPFFGPIEDLEAYFSTLKIRYVACVTEKGSHANYIRPYWFDRFYHHHEIWRRHAPYYIYILDAFVALSKRHRRIFEEDNMVVIDLEAPANPMQVSAP
jgi:hypothetical protein